MVYAGRALVLDVDVRLAPTLLLVFPVSHSRSTGSLPVWLPPLAVWSRPGGFLAEPRLW